MNFIIAIYITPKALREKESFLNFGDRESKTPLIYACFHNNTEVIKYLVGEGVDLDCRDDSNRSAIFYTVMNENKEMTELLLDKGADTRFIDEYHHDLFFYAKGEVKQMLSDKDKKTINAKVSERVNLWGKIFSR